MNNRLEIEIKLGVPLGEKGSNRKKIVEAFTGEGLPVRPTSVSRIKAEMISGKRTLWKLEALEVLKKDNAGLKNLFYEQITQVGLGQRRDKTAPGKPYVFGSDHFVEDIAKAIGQDPQVIRRCIRAMRTDMVLAQSDRVLPSQFCAIAEDYIEANFAIPPSLRSPSVTSLNRKWDHLTIEDFYSQFYAIAGKRAIGAWTPYEMEVFALFYKQQAAAENHLTPFDRSVLKPYIKGLPTSQIVRAVIWLTGIKIDVNVIEQHRNVLTVGRPVHGPTSR